MSNEGEGRTEISRSTFFNCVNIKHQLRFGVIASGLFSSSLENKNYLISGNRLGRVSIAGRVLIFVTVNKNIFNTLNSTEAFQVNCNT